MRGEESFSELLDRQLGLVLRHQATTAGLTEDAIRWRLARRSWQRVLPRVYATFTGALSDDQRLVAAALYGGPGSRITGVAALRWHGVRYLPKEKRIHVLVPSPHRRSSQGFVVVMKTNRPDQYSKLRPAMEICSLARAGVDAARSGYSQREVRAFLADIVQRNLASVSMLEEERRLGPKARSALLCQVLAELKDGVRSAPEAELRTVVRSSKILPPVRWNVRLAANDGKRLPTPDGWIQEVGIALEQNSREFHASPDGWHRTLDRHTKLAAYGVLTLHFTPQQVRDDPAGVLALIERAYLQRPRGFTGVVAE